MDTNQACNTSHPPPLKPQDKHLELHHAIRNIDSVIEHARAISLKISGPAPECEREDCVKSEQEPTLSQVLDGGSNAIRSKIDEAHAHLNTIENLLF